ncbi:hypothetical protein EWM64_g2980 [Hericium alpestre]|uniref:Uncharacterized protein n=1 Tax=Hericium alpestre TaxID=135208 RepID=A0A4Z0A531_9AGAM|nr:hypothetical protein EWM64_g2980 [Hericium alpestre]
MEHYYSGLGSLDDAETAAKLFDKAFDAVADSDDKVDRERGAFYIACQAGALATRFTQLTCLSDLDHAIDLLRGVLYTFSGVEEGLARIDASMHKTLGWKTAAISISACMHRRFLYQGNYEDALEVYGHLKEQTLDKKWSQHRLCQIHIALYKSICFIHNPEPRHIDEAVSLLNDQVLQSDLVAEAFLFHKSSQDVAPDQWTHRLDRGSASDPLSGVVRAFAFHALGEVLQRRFSYFRVPGDAEWCLKTLDEAAKIYDHDRRSTELPIIRALVCSDRYDSSGMVEHIDDAIKACREALALCSTIGQVDEWYPVFHLGIMLQLRSYHVCFVDDSDEDLCRESIPLLQESHQLLQRALDMLPKTYAYKEKSSNVLRYLGRSYFYDFMLSGEDSLAYKSFQSYRLALKTVPPDSSYRHIYLMELSDTIFQCYLQCLLPVDINDLDFAMTGPHDAIVARKGPYATQLKAAAQWGFNLLRFGLKLHDSQDGQQGEQSSVLPAPAQLYNRARVAYGHMMELIKKLFIGHSISTRLGYMRSTSQHVRVAAYITALFCGNPDLALEWLEQGRLVVWRQQQNVRASMLAEDVDDYDPVLATNLLDHAGFLEKAHSDPVDGSEPIRQAEERYLDGTPHHRLAAEYWECDIQNLRLQIPGYEDFLKPKQLADLRQALSHTSIGSIITLVATESPEMLHMKTLALILQAGEDHVRSVELELENHEVEELCEMMDGVLSNPTLRSRGSSRLFFKSSPGVPSSVQQVLSRLWYGVVKPVLQRLSLLVRLVKSNIIAVRMLRLLVDQGPE